MIKDLFAGRRKFSITAFLFAMACCNIALIVQEVSYLPNGYQDFTIYYTGALLLREGRASALYDLQTQYHTQLTFANAPIRRGALPFNHPPFEALFFVPLTLVTFWHAYLIWSTLNLAMLAASLALLRRFTSIRQLHPGLLWVAALAFFPLINGLLQGQDAVLLMFLAVLALVSLENGSDVAAGAWLACGMFRPHIMLPVVLLLAARRWRLLLGFVPVALVLLGIIVAIMGWSGPWEYVRFVLFVEKTGNGNFGPHVVPNLRGLLGSLVGPLSKPLAGVLILASSVAVFTLAFLRIRRGLDSLFYSFCLASAATILVCFHSLSYDLTLLLPLFLSLLAAFVSPKVAGSVPRGILVFLLALTPLYVYLNFALGHFYWFGLVVLWLFVRLMRMPEPAAEPA